MSPPVPAAGAAPHQRLDSWLWCARLQRQRAACAGMIQAGAVRLNREPITKPHARLRVGDVLTLQRGGEVLVLRVRALAARRGGSSAASALYTLIPASPSPCAAGQSSAYARGQPSE